jgi:hypothetical protein
MRLAPICLAVICNAISFSRAQEILDVKSILPTTLSSEELSQLPSDILDRALFSARTTSAEYLQEIADVLTEYVDGDIDLATARSQLADKLDELNYTPEPGVPDLSTDGRIDLILETNAGLASGYAYYQYRQQPALLDEWPAQELIRVAPRKKPRDLGPLPWALRWEMAGGTPVQDRLIARMDDDVWDKLGTVAPDGIPSPYPPFAFNSGMGVRAIDREEAVKLGVIEEDTQVEAQPEDFNSDLQASADIRDENLKSALTDLGYSVDDNGVVSL